MIILHFWLLYSHEPLKAIIVIAGIIIGILSAISVHEFAHALAVTRSGDETARRLGRLTLNPFAHIDPLGLFMFVAAGFGFGKPVPYSVRNLRKDTDEIVIALAGPLSNILLAIILALPYRVATIVGFDINQSLIFTFLDTLVSMNITLAVFNILPIPPLDGSKVLNYFLDYEAREFWERTGPIVLLALVLSSSFLQSSGVDPLGTIMTPLLHIANLIVRGAPQLF